MEDYIPPQEEYVSISGFNIPTSHKCYLENEVFIKELAEKYPHDGNLTGKMIEDIHGLFTMNIAMRDPEFVRSLERALTGIKEGRVMVLEDGFFDG